MFDYTSLRVKKDIAKKARKLQRDLGLKSIGDLLAFLLDSQNVETLRQWKDKINELHRRIRETEKLLSDYRSKVVEMLVGEDCLKSEIGILKERLRGFEKCKKEKARLMEDMGVLSSDGLKGEYVQLKAKYFGLEEAYERLLDFCVKKKGKTIREWREEI